MLLIFKGSLKKRKRSSVQLNVDLKGLQLRLVQVPRSRASELNVAEQRRHLRLHFVAITSSTPLISSSYRSSMHAAHCPPAPDSSRQHISKLAKLKQWLRMVAKTLRLPQGLSLVKAFFAQLFSMRRPVCSDQNQQAGASQHPVDESGDSCSVSCAKSVSAKTDRVSSATAASSSQSSHAAAASRSGLISAVTTSSSARTTPQTRRQQPPVSAAVRGLSTKFVAAVDDDESSLVFGFPSAPGGSDGDVSGVGGAASGGQAQQKASSPPAASVK